MFDDDLDIEPEADGTYGCLIFFVVIVFAFLIAAAC